MSKGILTPGPVRAGPAADRRPPSRRCWSAKKRWCRTRGARSSTWSSGNRWTTRASRWHRRNRMRRHEKRPEKKPKMGWVVAVKPLKIGSLRDGFRAVEEGLAATDKVIVTGVQRVRPGKEVKPTERAAVHSLPKICPSSSPRRGQARRATRLIVDRDQPREPDPRQAPLARRRAPIGWQLTRRVRCERRHSPGRSADADHFSLLIG